MGRSWGWRLVVWAVLLTGCGATVGTPEEATATQDNEEVVQNTGGPRTGATRWAQRLTGPSEERAGGVVHDGDGNLLIAANFEGSLSDNRGTLGTASGKGSVVAKYRPDGTRVWARTLPASVTAIGTNRARHVLVTGNVTGTVDLGGGPLSLGEFPTGIYLAEYDASGRHVWSRAFPLEYTSFFEARRLLVDGEGHLVLTGTLRGAIYFGGGHSVVADSSVALVRLTPRGDYEWSFAEIQFGDAAGVDVDEDNNLYLAGTIITDILPPFDFIPFVYKFSPSGTVLWQRTLETKFGAMNAVAVHGNRVVLTGAFSDSLTFGGQTFIPERSQEGFLVAFTRSGETRWGKQLGLEGLDLAMDHRDDLVLVGRYQDGDDLGRGLVSGVPGSDLNLFVAKFDRVEGTPRWTRGLSQAQPEDVSTSVDRFRVSVDEQGSAAFLGGFVAPLDVGPVTLRPAGVRDLFLLDLKP